MANVRSIIYGLKPPSFFGMAGASLKLGNSFSVSPGMKKILQILAERYTTESDKEAISNIRMGQNTRFGLFVMILNDYFDREANKIVEGMEKDILALSHELQISHADHQAILHFFSVLTPYSDKTDCVYIAPKNANQLIKAKGLQVYFKHSQPNDILYLKYFETYNFFLSKTFTSRHSNNSISTSFSIHEINIINENVYTKLDFEIPSFQKLKEEIKKFNPLQKVNVKESETCPKIVLDPEKGIVIISGPCFPLSYTTYFDPIFEWLGMFSLSGKTKLKIYLKFKYFNNYTARFLMNLTVLCNSPAVKDQRIHFYWYYDEEDDEMREFGEHLQSQFKNKGKFYVLETKTLIKDT